jgi:hypothetical protein
MLSETCFYHDESKTLILTDTFVNMKNKMNTISRITFSLVGTYHKIGMSKAIKMNIDDKKIFHDSIQELLNFPFEKVMLSHGDTISRSELKLAIKILNL